MILVIELIVINILAFILYGVDKRKAHDHKWRLSEFSLIFIAVIGGAPGAFIGMRIFHHKTRKPKFYITIPVLLIIQVVAGVSALYQNYHLTVSEYKLDIGLNKDMRIVQISDLHNQFFGIKQSILLDRISECEPDIIVVTGDVVDSWHTSYTLAEEFFEGAVKICPVYYITGNHEVRMFGERFDSFLNDIQSMGVVFLDDTYIDQGDYIIAGIADESLYSFAAYGAFDGTKPVVMLAHEPGYYNLYESLGADVVFTGHVHGGQIIIPGKGGVFSPDLEFFPKYYKGVHTFGDTNMIISRGLGNSVLPIKINNYPEIVVADLT